MFEITEIQEIMSHFGLSVQEINDFIDTSHGDEDKRINYIIEKRFVKGFFCKSCKNLKYFLLALVSLRNEG